MPDRKIRTLLEEFKSTEFVIHETKRRNTSFKVDLIFIAYSRRRDTVPNEMIISKKFNKFSTIFNFRCFFLSFFVSTLVECPPTKGSDTFIFIAFSNNRENEVQACLVNELSPCTRKIFKLENEASPRTNENFRLPILLYQLLNVSTVYFRNDPFVYLEYRDPTKSRFIDVSDTYR